MSISIKRYKSAHSDAVESSFELASYDGAEPFFKRPLMILAFTNRSGSNLLSDLLFQTNKFGRAGELLNADAIKKISIKFSIKSFPEYIKFIEKYSGAENKVIGLKASCKQIYMLNHYGILNMFPSVKVVHIIRNDTIAQAVSYYIAMNTKQWTSEQKKQNCAEVEYNFKGIKACLSGAQRENQGIYEVCSALNLPKIEIYYEDLDAEPSKQVARVLQNFSLRVEEDNINNIAPRISKQSSIINAKFAEQFRNDQSRSSSWLVLPRLFLSRLRRA